MALQTINGESLSNSSETINSTFRGNWTKSSVTNLLLDLRDKSAIIRCNCNVFPSPTVGPCFPIR
jgi:hypothetical protein